MTVSAVIPTYNRRKYLRRAIDSILAQTVPVDEIVVVDDGSDDGTADAIAEWYGAKVHVVAQQNAGAARARQRGVQEATGDWIAFLDSDDEWMPERNRHLLKAASCVPAEVAWIFGDLRVVTDAGEGDTLYKEHHLSITEVPTVFPDIFTVEYPFHMLQASLIRRSALLQVKCFSEGLRSDDDLLAGYQMATKYGVAAVPQVVGRLFRTSDLAESSVFLNGIYGSEHFRARLMAYSLVIQSGRKHPWIEYYAAQARFQAQVMASRGPVPRHLAFEQFRFGCFSMKAIAFFVVAMFGGAGIRTWNAAGRFRRTHFPKKDEQPSYISGASHVDHRWLRRALKPSE
jgi:glycosyltransferase involved in cell wall biosynthesis